MIPPEPPVAITTWPERRGAVKGAPAFWRGEENPWRRAPFGHRLSFDGRRSGIMILLVGFERFAWTVGPITASALARRLITLIYAGWNRS